MTFVKVVIRAEDTGRILFQHRDNKINIGNPNLWTLIGGACESGEDPEEGAMREVEEETGILLASVKYLGICTIETMYKDGRATVPCDLRTYIATVPKEAKTRLGEGQELRWMTIQEFTGLPAPSGMKEFLREHARTISGKSARDEELLPTAANAFIRAEDTGRFCFERRGESRVVGMSGALSLLGGKSEAGETPEDTVRREVREESGLLLSSLELLEIREIDLAFTDGRDAKTDASAYFSATTPREEEGSEESEVEIVWLTLPQALTEPLAPNVAELINKFRSRLLR